MDYQLIISLLTLIALEVVLGIDNIIFISILAGKLPPEQQRKARNIAVTTRNGNATWLASSHCCNYKAR